MSPSRRSVATVLFTDIVGSTEAAQRLGDRRWRDVLAQHHTAVRIELRKYQGEEIATAGDGFLAVFVSPALALLCADAICKHVRELGLEIRAGIHHGEIQRDDGSVGGIAVHIGSRVASLAEAGEVLVSGTVRDAVQGAGFDFEDRGERALKGVSEAWHLYALTASPEDLEEELLTSELASPSVRGWIVATVVAVGILIAVGIVAIRSNRDNGEHDLAVPSTSSEAATPAAIDRSIAVLPFEVRSSNADDQYFASGMHDDLLTRLAQIDSLKVISRTSVERYADTTTPVRRIADELGVATILEGSVQRSGDRIHLTVQLIDAREDEHLWAATYDEKLTAENLFAIQSSLSERIAGSLRARLRSGMESYVGARPTESLDAYLHWARGTELAERDPSASGIAAADEEFHAAIAADSTYALPWAALAWNEAFKHWIGISTAEEAYPRAQSAIDRALTLEPRLGAAHVLRGMIFSMEWRFEEAEASLLRAIHIAPGSAYAHAWYGRLLRNLERFGEAEAEARRALELDPMNGELIQDLGWVRLLQGDLDGASQYARRALEIDPDGNAWWLLVNALAMKGDHDAALKAIETGRQRDPLAPWNVMTAIAYARVGNRPEALRWLDRVGPDAPGPVLLSVAAVHGMLGDADRAFAILDSLTHDDPYMLVLLSYDPDFDSIRDDPRFEDVRRRAREEVMRRNQTY